VPERRRVLIVCEGAKTEPIYLKTLVASLGMTTAQVEVSGEGDPAPTSVVNFGESKFKDDPDFDLVFFVFDRDSHKDYDAALLLVENLQKQPEFKGKVVAAITSIPCFEIWFLLHFEAHARPYEKGGRKSACGNLIAVLKGKKGFENYSKGRGDHFELLHGRLPQAKINAARTLKQLREVGAPEHHGNPTTLMHTLVDALEKVAAEYKR
jgi:hypothetical protein